MFCDTHCFAWQRTLSQDKLLNVSVHSVPQDLLRVNWRKVLCFLRLELTQVKDRAGSARQLLLMVGRAVGLDVHKAPECHILYHYAYIQFPDLALHSSFLPVYTQAIAYISGSLPTTQETWTEFPGLTNSSNPGHWRSWGAGGGVGGCWAGGRKMSVIGKNKKRLATSTSATCCPCVNCTSVLRSWFPVCQWGTMTTL